MPIHALADVHHLRVESDQRMAKLERRIEDLAALGPMAVCPVAVGSVVGEQKGGIGMDVMIMEEQFGVMGSTKEEELVVGAGARVGKERVKEMLMRERGEKWGIVGISGIGGSGKTTLAREICRDLEIRGMTKDCFAPSTLIFLIVNNLFFFFCSSYWSLGHIFIMLGFHIFIFGLLVHFSVFSSCIGDL